MVKGFIESLFNVNDVETNILHLPKKIKKMLLQLRKNNLLNSIKPQKEWGIYRGAKDAKQIKNAKSSKQNQERKEIISTAAHQQISTFPSYLQIFQSFMQRFLLQPGHWQKKTPCTNSQRELRTQRNYQHTSTLANQHINLCISPFLRI